MKVKIVAATQPRIEGIENGEEFISFAARVSNPSNQMNTETSGKLLKYCMKNKHYSIFQMVNVVMEVETTRDIGRQILRHEFDVQEFSQRYADPSQDLGFVIREARLQDTKNRQNSIEMNNRKDWDGTLIAEKWEQYQKNVITNAKAYYQWAINNGIAKECARVILPEGLTLSRMYLNNSLRGWFFYCQLRMSEGTQKEHREVARACWELLKEEYPFLKEIQQENAD